MASPQAQPACASGAVVAPAAGAERRARVQERNAELDRIAKIDAALAVLRDDDASTRAALEASRQCAAARVAATKPLGTRLEQAKKAHTRAVAVLQAAEQAAIEATEKAQVALTAEHAAAGLVADLEREVALIVVPTRACDGPARQFLNVVQAWAKDSGVGAPPDVNAAAEALQAALQHEDPPTEESPTDLEAACSSEVRSPTEEGDETSTSTHGALPDAVMAAGGGGIKATLIGPLPPAVRRRTDGGPYAQSASQ